MRRVVDDERMMLKVCDMYYNRNMGQQEIARALSLSRPTVSKLISGAREHGLVRIILTDLDGRNHIDEEVKLERRYGLKKVIVTDSFEDVSALQNALGYAGAKFLERILTDGNIVGISMGTTLARIAPHIEADYLHGLTFVPMVGGVGDRYSELHANYICEALAKAFNGVGLTLNVPALVSSAKVKQDLMKEDSIARVLSLTDRLDVSLSGIGAPEVSSSIIQAGYFSEDMLDELRQSDIAGDICMRYYCADGAVADYEYNRRVVGIDVEKLHRVPYSIGVAGGKEKARAVLGAVRGGYINVLITDLSIAEALLADEE